MHSQDLCWLLVVVKHDGQDIERLIGQMMNKVVMFGNSRRPFQCRNGRQLQAHVGPVKPVLQVIFLAVEVAYVVDKVLFRECHDSKVVGLVRRSGNVCPVLIKAGCSVPRVSPDLSHPFSASDGKWVNACIILWGEATRHVPTEATAAQR